MSINCNQSITLDTEIRKLQPAHIFKLSMLLNVSDSWKQLMAIVPKGDNGKHLFNSDHFSLIEQASQQQKRGCTEIFLDEWSTMGRKRPTLRNLLDLLTKAELYRAADYIAIDILNWKDGPRRPNSGPAAQIDLSALLLESRDGIVETTSSISGDVYMDHSFVNKMGNSQECIPEESLSEENKMSYQIPAFLKDVSFSSFGAESISEKSPQIISSTSSESYDFETTNELKSNSSEIDTDKVSAKLPRCLLEMSLPSLESQEISVSKIANESSQSASKNETSNVLIPRMIVDLTDSQ